MLKRAHAFLRVRDRADSKMPFMGGALLFAAAFAQNPRGREYVERIESGTVVAAPTSVVTL